MSKPVHLGFRATEAYLRRIDRVRDELAKDVGVDLTRSQTFRMLLDAALPKAEARLGLPAPHKEVLV
jgi:hypothetical protein